MLRPSGKMVALLLLLALTGGARAFYLPGVAPQDFQAGDSISFKVNKLMSVRNLPYDYYTLPFCKPEAVESSTENLGELLRGDRILNSVYKAQFRRDLLCEVACASAPLSPVESARLTSFIKDDYRANLILDNLPVGTPRVRASATGDAKAVHERGIAIGHASEGGGTVFLHNHLRFTVRFHVPDAARAAAEASGADAGSLPARIVGFEAEPMSIAHGSLTDGQRSGSQPLETCPDAEGKIEGRPSFGWSRSTPAPAPGEDSFPRQEVAPGAAVAFTYDVLYRESETPWASRWDTYLISGENRVHWFSIINSSLVVAFLAGMVAMILARALKRDISNYNALEGGAGGGLDDAGEESGWKLVHGDVFRPPKSATWLATAVGTGVQLGCCAVGTLAAAALGFLSPANRGGLITALLLLYVLSGGAGGYAAAWLDASLGGGSVGAVSHPASPFKAGAKGPPSPPGSAKVAAAAAVAAGAGGAKGGGLLPTTTRSLVSIAAVTGGVSAARQRGRRARAVGLRVALTFPASVSVVFLLLDLAAAGQRSSGAVPLGTLASLLSLWVGVSTPLCLLGASLGARAGPIEAPVRTNKIPRAVPPQPWYVGRAFAAAVGGVLPFGAVFIELFFLLSSFWMNQFYYLFGFLGLVFLLLLLTTAEISIVLVYFQLCSEDHRWWWRSFFAAGSSAIYLFLYSCVYFVTRLDITRPVPIIMYFGYALIASAGFFLLMGTTGFLACYYFVHKIYAAVKID